MPMSGAWCREGGFLGMHRGPLAAKPDVPGVGQLDLHGLGEVAQRVAAQQGFETLVVAFRESALPGLRMLAACDDRGVTDDPRAVITLLEQLEDLVGFAGDVHL